MVKDFGAKDRYGLHISTASTTAAEKLVEGVDLALESAWGADEKFQEALHADEGFALAHAGLAFRHMVGGRAADARKSVQEAQSLATGTSRREQQQIEIIARWANGKGTEALILVNEHLAEYPRDMLIVRLAQRLFVLGCSSVGAGVANYPREHFALMKKVAPAYGDDWAFLAQSSFAHHEVGLLDEALTMAERALEERPTDAVASHSVAHVYFERADSSSGAEFLERWLPGFDNRAPYHVHLSWHLALFELAMGRYQNALEVYGKDIRPSVVAKSAISLNDSASLMWRLQIYGAAAPSSLMEELDTQAAPAADNPGSVAFRDSHAALAFAVANDDESLTRMMDGLKAAADKGDKLVGDVTLPLVRGITAFMHQDYDEAVRLMGPLFGSEAPYDQLSRIGGSHAQREVFEDTLTEAYLRARQFENAEALLENRLKRRETPRDLFWLARAQQATGKPEAAEASVQQVRNAWRNADPESQEIVALSGLAKSLS